MREMKDSGVKWIGRIPQTWKTIRFKYLHDGLNTGEAIDKDYWSDSDNDRVFYTAGLVPIRTDYTDFPEWKYTTSDDILLARNGTPYVYFPLEGACYTDHIIRASMKKGICKKFVQYSLQHSIASVVVETVSIPTWSASLWNEQEIPWPDCIEQIKIADFLDKKCLQVDTLISNVQTQIEKLKAYKQSLITEVVTKSLDPTVPMKDSGVEWIGEIPEKWDVSMLSSLFSHRKCKNDGMQNNNLLSLSYGNIIEKSINTCDGLLPASFEGYNIIVPGCIVLRLTDLQNDHTSLRVGHCNEKGIITSAYVTIELRNKLDQSRYFYYAIHSFDVKKGFYGMGSGVRQGLTFDGVKKLLLPVPSRTEQAKIVDYLDEKCAQIDRLIAIKEQKIEKLDQYKKSLIYEYVTGKREV